MFLGQGWDVASGEVGRKRQGGSPPAASWCSNWKAIKLRRVNEVVSWLGILPPTPGLGLGFCQKIDGGDTSTEGPWFCLEREEICNRTI